MPVINDKGKPQHMTPAELREKVMEEGDIMVVISRQPDGTLAIVMVDEPSEQMVEALAAALAGCKKAVEFIQKARAAAPPSKHSVN